MAEPAETLPEAPALDQETRRLGVSASEIAAIMGLSEYQDAYIVYLRKVGELREDPSAAARNIPLRMGRVQESELLKIYSEITNKKLIRPGTLTHPDRPWQVATPDAMVVDERRGVECKTTGWRMAHEWGDPEIPEEADRVPTECFMQCQYGMSVTGSVDWDVPALIGGEFGIYHIQFDREIEEMMLAAAREFIEKHLIPHIPPPIGWSPASAAWLKKKFPTSQPQKLIATSETIQLATRLYALKKIEAAVERATEETKNRIKLIMGDAEGLRGIGWEIRWKKNRDGVRTEWEQVARWVAQTYNVPREDFLTAVETFSKTRPGNRPFGPHRLPDAIFARLLSWKEVDAIDAIRTEKLLEEREKGQDNE